MKRFVALFTLTLVLAAVSTSPAFAQEGNPDVTEPDGCARCHEEAHQAWSLSDHADTLSNPTFIEAFNRSGQSTTCYRCHASGYNPYDGDFDYEGIDCLTCHEFAEGDEGPHMLTTATDDTCAQCHTGNHAPAYDQWLTSDHATANIGCLDCHLSHSTDLHKETTTALCTSCHEVDMSDSVHDVEGMACESCHMADGDHVIDELSGTTNGAGHTFNIPPTVCGDCHGMAHTIMPSEDGGIDVITAISSDLEACEAETEATAANKLNLGLTGGGIAGLFVGIGIPFLLIRRRQK